MTQHEQIVAAYETYIAENEKFTAKGVKAAAPILKQYQTAMALDGATLHVNESAPAIGGEALERLGPIFVKFGQVLSTRRDLLAPDIAEELAKLQDRVPPFSSAIAEIGRAHV